MKTLNNPQRVIVLVDRRRRVCTARTPQFDTVSLVSKSHAARAAAAQEFNVPESHIDLTPLSEFTIAATVRVPSKGIAREFLVWAAVFAAMAALALVVIWKGRA